MTTTALRTNPHPQRGFGIDPRLDAATLRAPAASKEDSHRHAILKFQPRNSFDYRVHYEPQLNVSILKLYPKTGYFAVYYTLYFLSKAWKKIFFVSTF